MTVEKDDLGLSLSLNFTQHQTNLRLNPSVSASVSSSSAPFRLLRKSSWNESFNSSSAPRALLRGIDVNRPANCDDDVGVSSPNSTVSSSSGKRSDREPNGSEENDRNTLDTDPQWSRGNGISDEEDGDPSRKKLRLSKDQSAVLEDTFKDHNTLNPKQKMALAKQLGLRPRQVEVWFQNRRARTKLKQTEVDCEFLRRCCENLTDENRRLQKEVAELRALKLSPQFYMHMAPPTTLTICSSCERVSLPPPPTSAAISQFPSARGPPSLPALPFEALRRRS